MKKALIVSLDLMLALPIISIALLLLFSNIRNSQAYLLAAARYQNKELRAFSVSQSIAQQVDQQPINYTAALALAESLTANSSLRASLNASQASNSCASAVCRILTISGARYYLVISYANSS